MLGSMGRPRIKKFQVQYSKAGNGKKHWCVIGRPHGKRIRHWCATEDEAIEAARQLNASKRKIKFSAETERQAVKVLQLLKDYSKESKFGEWIIARGRRRIRIGLFMGYLDAPENVLELLERQGHIERGFQAKKTITYQITQQGKKRTGKETDFEQIIRYRDKIPEIETMAQEYDYNA